MSHISPSEALWFLPFVIPIALWVAWSDMKYMLIRNTSVLVLLLIFIVIGPFALTSEAYLWRFSHFAVVLLIGFLLNAGGAIGGGDAKFAAAMALFIAKPDLVFVLVLFAVISLAAVATHRAFAASSYIRGVSSNWQSWTQRHHFPMGLALSGTLMAYLGIGAFLS